MALPPFQSLLDDHGPDVHHLLVGLLGRVEADDAYQETFLAALRAYPRVVDTNLRGWLFTIAYRKATDAHRHRSRTVSVADVPETGGRDTTTNSELWHVVEDLPPKQKAAVLHRYRDDWSYERIADRLGTSAPAARRNVHEGIKKLKESWR